MVCLNQYFKKYMTANDARSIDNYIAKSSYFCKPYKFVLNNKRRKWHIERSEALQKWLKRSRGVDI